MAQPYNTSEENVLCKKDWKIKDWHYGGFALSDPKMLNINRKDAVATAGTLHQPSARKLSQLVPSNVFFLRLYPSYRINNEWK